MGACASAPAVRDSSSRQPQASGAPRCALCGEAAPRPLRKLPQEARDEWVERPEGPPCHRRCLVAQRLEEARFQREQESYRRAKQQVYPLPAAHYSHAGEPLHRVESGAEWARSESFKLPHHPSASMIATLERQLQQQEATEVAVAQQEAQAPDVGAQQQDEQQAQQQAQLQSFESASSSLVSGSRSSSNNSLAQQQGSVICQQCRGRRPLLRRPSPVHHPALLEAKTQRRLAGPHPSFDEEALQHDPDGAAGKAWRQRKKAEAVEARRRAQREAERQCECNGF